VRVGILGGGRWGQALARLVMAAGHDPWIAYRDVRPPHVLPSTDDPPRVTEGCDLILVAVSAARLRGSIQLARPHPGNRVVIAGRGVEPGTGVWLTDVVRQECDAVRVGALGGPAPVDEILNGGLCAGVVASPYDEVCRMAVQALHSSRYRVYASSDLAGVQLTGATVPVLAALVGLARNLRGAGVGVHAMVLSRGLAETGRLARALGAEEATLFGLAGIGELVAVHATPDSPYFQAGARLARGEPGDGPWGIAEALLKLGAAHKIDLPLTQTLVDVHRGADPVEAIQGLMSRRSAREHR
jgi:glycerol-3-phosphate dehydrogenase (NAD(P)+)